MTLLSTTRPRPHLQQQVTTGTGAKSHYYGPVSLKILAGFLEDDEDVLPHPGLQRPSSTVAVVNGGGGDTPTPPPHPVYLPPPLRGGFRGYKPASRDLVRALFDEDEEDQDETGTAGGTKIKTQTPAPQPTRGYKQASESLLGGFSDDEDEGDEWEDLYGASDDEGNLRNKRNRTGGGNVGNSGGKRIPPRPGNIRLSRIPWRRRAGERNGGEQEEPLIDLSDGGAAVAESRQTDISVAFRRNQGSVAPSDLPGYFAPEDLRYGTLFSYPVIVNSLLTLLVVSDNDTTFPARQPQPQLQQPQLQPLTS